MKFKHYYSFATKISDGTHNTQTVDLDWDSLRTTGEQAFALEDSKEEYIQNAKQTRAYQEYAKEILNVIEGDKSLCSLGVGKGILEWWIKALSPDIELCCTDYTEKSLEKLKAYFPECNEIKVFDMLHGEYSVLADYDAILMFRVSTEFDTKEWDSIFAKIVSNGIKKLVFVPSELMTIKDVAGEIYRKMKAKVRGEKSAFCGWMYSEAEFEKMFAKHFRIEKKKYIFNTGIYVLRAKMV